MFMSTFKFKGLNTPLTNPSLLFSNSVSSKTFVDLPLPNSDHTTKHMTKATGCVFPLARFNIGNEHASARARAHALRRHRLRRRRILHNRLLMSGERGKNPSRRYVRKRGFNRNNTRPFQLDVEIKLFRISTHPSLLASDAAELRHGTLFQSCVEREAVVIPSILYLTSSHSRDEVIAKSARHVCRAPIGRCVCCGRLRRK